MPTPKRSSANNAKANKKRSIRRISHKDLKQKFEKLENELPPKVALRCRRATSWITHAHNAKENDDTDSQFISLWIAFNSLYGTRYEASTTGDVQSEQFNEFLEKVAKHDRGHRIRDAIWSRLSEQISKLMGDKYLYPEFWDFHHKAPKAKDWEKSLQGKNRHFRKVFERKELDEVLKRIFERLYVLRNQIFHGCATQKGSLNRRQLRLSAEILEFLIPIFLAIVLENPDEKYWGLPSYPPLDRIELFD